MKKLFSHPLFYYTFVLLGILGCALQVWFCSIEPDAEGLLPQGHISTTLTLVVTVLTAVLAVLSTPYVQTPHHPVAVRAAGAFAAAGFMGIAAFVLLARGNLLSGILSALAAVGSVYVGMCRVRRQRVHYCAYALFALCFMFYLISCYRVWSAEPETVRYLFKLLALVCAMLVFYQKAALHARTGRFATYHFWRCMTLMLCLTAIPSATSPTLYLAAAVWMILDSSPRPRRKETPKTEGEEA